MALLAEQKRKAKFGLDPRNTSWSNDSSKFGQRLLEKMGWEKGKGLGAHEDGITEHIKASYKSDSRGLGCTPQDADAWIAHQDDFNDLLKALNSQNGAGQEEQAEQKATHVDGRKRYYGRFSRGQVQTLRSTDDLDCIFGKRKRNSKKAVSDKPPATQPGDGDGEDEKRHGLTTVTSTSSVQEYFAKKMAEMKARKETNGNSSVDADPSESSQRRHGLDCEKKPSAYSTVGFSYNVNEMKETSSPAGVGVVSGEQRCRGWYQDFLKDNSSSIENIDIKKSSKKKKRKKMKSDNEDNDGDLENKMSDDKKRKTKKKSKDKMSNGFVPILESSELPSTCKVEENKSSKKKKNKENETAVAASACDSTADINDENQDRKKHKKKKQKTCNKDEIVNDSSNRCALDDNGVNDANNFKHSSKIAIIEINDRTQKEQIENSACDGHKKKNKKKRKYSEINIDEESRPVESKSDNNDDVVKSKKKKKKKDGCTAEPDNAEQSNDNDTTAEHKCKKQSAENKDVSNVTQPSGQKEDKRKKKKKKKAKRAKEQCTKSQAFFPGSNIADIIGYGLKSSETAKCSKEKSKSSKKKK
ncbi:hypothetical protein BsWGS_18805 [Bradybaena similaris]